MSRLPKSAMQPRRWHRSRSSCRAAQGRVAGQLGGEEREAEDGAQESRATCVNTPAVGQGASRGRARIAQAHHAYPQPHGERYSQAALHQAGGWELEQNADHRREGEDAAEQVGGVRQALDMGGEGEVELVEQDLVAACQQGEPHEGALAHYLPHWRKMAPRGLGCSPGV
jgi:hypothetical protein